MTIETTIKGGLPVLASGTFVKADIQDGELFDSIEDLQFYWRPHSQNKMPVECCITISEEDIERVCDELMEAHFEYRAAAKSYKGETPW